MSDTIFPKSTISHRQIENAVRRGHQLRSQALYDMITGIGRRRAA